MFTYISNVGSRIVYFTEEDSTFLQSIEGTLVKRAWIALPSNVTRANSLEYWVDYRDQLVHEPANIPEKDQLTAKKCELLHQSQRLMQHVRYPYHKNAYMQEYAYERKYNDACNFLASDRSSYDKFAFLADEIDLSKRDPVIVAQEIVRMRQEREDIMRYSERARRAFQQLIGEATTQAQLAAVEPMLTVRNFKLPFEI